MAKLVLKAMTIIVTVGFLYVVFDKLNVIRHMSTPKYILKNAYQESGVTFKRTDVVILFTMMRSGSSILGSIFDKREDVTYLYEPLVLFRHLDWKKKVDERVRVLRHSSKCELEEVTKIYRNLHLYNNDFRCREDSICFMEGGIKFSRFLSRDMDLCQLKGNLHECKHPVDFAALNKFCRQSTLRAIKTIRLFKLEWLLPLLDDETYQVKIIHLVRDPRGTVNSRIMEDPSKRGKIKAESSEICEQLLTNTLFSDKMLRDHPHYRHKYMRVRYEDFALKPVNYSQKIYDFIGINMLPSIRSWLVKATSQDNPSGLSGSNPQGLKRNPRAVLSSWRKSLSMEQVQTIQNICSEAITKLGYKIYNNTIELRNTGSLHFEPKSP